MGVFKDAVINHSISRMFVFQVSGCESSAFYLSFTYDLSKSAGRDQSLLTAFLVRILCFRF